MVGEFGSLGLECVKTECPNPNLKSYPFLHKNSLIENGLPPTNEYFSISSIITTKEYMKGVASPYSK